VRNIKYKCINRKRDNYLLLLLQKTPVSAGRGREQFGGVVVRVGGGVGGVGGIGVGFCCGRGVVGKGEGGRSIGRGYVEAVHGVGERVEAVSLGVGMPPARDGIHQIYSNFSSPVSTSLCKFLCSAGMPKKRV
jgi:hypothetical protein